MPAIERGFTHKRGSRWLAGWYENGAQRTRGGFETKTKALEYANAKADEAVARETAIRLAIVSPSPPLRSAPSTSLSRRSSPATASTPRRRGSCARS